MIATGGYYVLRPSTATMVSNNLIQIAATYTGTTQFPPDMEAVWRPPTFQAWLSSQPRWFKRQYRTGAQQQKLMESLQDRGWFVYDESGSKSFDKAR